MPQPIAILFSAKPTVYNIPSIYLHCLATEAGLKDLASYIMVNLTVKYSPDCTL